MIKNTSFEKREYNHGISLWLVLDAEGSKSKVLLGSKFKNNEEVDKYVTNMQLSYLSSKINIKGNN